MDRPRGSLRTGIHAGVKSFNHLILEPHFDLICRNSLFILSGAQ